MADKHKRYYWLKLHKNFFNDIRMKRLRKIAGGETLIIIYMKMMLQSLANDGYLYFEGVFGNVHEELALMIDEDIDDVKAAIEYLTKVGLLTVSENGLECYLTEMTNCIGSESESAKRVREFRKRQKQITNNNLCNETALHCNKQTLHCNEDTQKHQEANNFDDKQVLQSNETALHCSKQTLHCNEADSEALNSRYNVTLENRDINNINKINTNVLILSSHNKKIERQNGLNDPDETIQNNESVTEKEEQPVNAKSLKMYQPIIDEWNSLKEYGITPIIAINSNTQRAKMLKCRLNQYGADSFEKAIEQIKNSDFLQGKNKTSFMITFDWLVKPNNYPKVLEGNYRNNPNRAVEAQKVQQFRTRNFVQIDFPGSPSYAGNMSDLESQLLDN